MKRDIILLAVYCQRIIDARIEMSIGNKEQKFLPDDAKIPINDYPHQFLNSSQIRHKSLAIYVKLSLQSGPRISECTANTTRDIHLIFNRI